MKLIQTLASIAAFASMTAHAVVISDSQILFEQNGEDYAITAIQTDERNDPTTFWFNKLDESGTSLLQPVTWHVDEMADYYLVEAGDIFTSATIAAGKFAPLLSVDGAFDVAVPYPGMFYLGVATGSGFGVSGPNRDALGWVKFQNDGSGLTMLGNAMSYREGGIIIGTTTAVPEPHRAALMLLGMLGIGMLVRKR